MLGYSQVREVSKRYFTKFIDFDRKALTSHEISKHILNVFLIMLIVGCLMYENISDRKYHKAILNITHQLQDNHSQTMALLSNHEARLAHLHENLPTAIKSELHHKEKFHSDSRLNNKIHESVQDIKQMIQDISSQLQLISESTSQDTINTKIQTQIEALKDSVNAISTERHDPSRLPFEIISIDYWHGVPKVTVQLDGHEALMGLNSERAGWVLAEIDMSKKEAKFRNKEGGMITQKVLA